MASAVGAGLAVLSTPIVGITLGVMALAGAGVYLYNKFEGVRTVIGRFFSGLGTSLSPVISEFKTAFSDIGTSIMTIARPIGRLFGWIWEAIGGFKTLGVIAKGIGWVIGKAFSAIIHPIKWVIELISTGLKAVSYVADKFGSFFGSDDKKTETGPGTKSVTKQPIKAMPNLEAIKQKEISWFGSFLGSDEEVSTKPANNIVKKSIIATSLASTLAVASPQTVDIKNPITDLKNHTVQSQLQTKEPNIFNFNGGITISSQDGIIDAESFKAQLITVLDEIDFDKRNTSFDD